MGSGEVHAPATRIKSRPLILYLLLLVSDPHQRLRWDPTHLARPRRKGAFPRVRDQGAKGSETGLFSAWAVPPGKREKPERKDGKLRLPDLPPLPYTVITSSQFYTFNELTLACAPERRVVGRGVSPRTRTRTPTPPPLSAGGVGLGWG